jgi:16S rRNA (uracil1498-N3)-methyltransferase
VYVDAGLSPGARIELPAAAGVHLAKVLRVRSGDELVLFSGDGREFPASVESVRGTKVAVALGEARAVDRESPIAVTLVQCIARADRMDLIVQKATELGVGRIVPVQSRRGVVRLEAAQAQSKAAHWRAIAVSACEQCGRNRLPGIETPRRLIDYLAQLPEGGVRLLFEPDAPAGRALSAVGREVARAVTVAVGPEGGFDEEELEAFRLAGFQAMSLGPRVLRTETAAIAALAWLQTRYGDLDLK